MTIIFLYTFILFVTLCLITFLFVGIIIRSRGTIIITSFGIVIQTILFCFFRFFMFIWIIYNLFIWPIFLLYVFCYFRLNNCIKAHIPFVFFQVICDKMAVSKNTGECNSALFIVICSDSSINCTVNRWANPS